MKFKVSAVSFLNTIPLIDALAADSVELTREMPSRLAARLESGAADVALVPVVEVFRGRAAAVVPGIGIACRGAVESVKFFYRSDLDQVKLVRSDRGSRSSVALLEVLFREKFGRCPTFAETEPVPGKLPNNGEGVLVIGDRCFEYEAYLRTHSVTAVKSLDLGQAWLELTGLSFVFAVWGVSKSFLAGATPAESKDLSRLLTEARDVGVADLDCLAATAAGQGKLGYKGEAATDAVVYYFKKSLRFHLGEPEMMGLAHFHELCVKHNIIPARPLPPIL